MTKGRAIDLIVEKSYPLPDGGAGVRLMYALDAIELAESDARERAIRTARLGCLQSKGDGCICHIGLKCHADADCFTMINFKNHYNE